MKRPRKKTLILIFFAYLIFLFVKYLRFFLHDTTQSKLFILKDTKRYTQSSNQTLILHSKCLCQTEIIYVNKLASDNVYNIHVTDIKNEYFYAYNLSINSFELLVTTCDLYNVLRRGPNQKILSYSLLNKEK